MQFLELNWFESGLRYIMAWLCSFIYPLISLVYNLFRYVSQVNILSSDTVQPIYQRVTVILTIIMVFYITFEFVKYIVEPSGFTDKEKGAGKLVYKMIAVVVLIAFVPTIFTYAFKFQNVIVDKDIIGKVILGNNNNVSDNYGGEFSESIFKLFYQISEEGDGATCGDMPCNAIVSANYTALRNNNSLPYITTGLNESHEKEEESFGEKITVNTPYIEFNGLFAVVVGGLIAYILILYCVDVGTRWAQLVFLQVIAPIPIIGFLSPKKDGIFQKWYKQCLTTYLDLFIRIAIINFVLLISRILLNGLESNDLFTELSGISGFMKTLVIIVLILGLMIFAQKAPKLLGELFPKMGAAAGNFGLKGGERVAPMARRVIGSTLGGAAGAVAGVATGIGQGIRRRKALGKDGKPKGVPAGIWGATKGAVGGLVGGTVRGMYNGGKKGNVFKNSISGAQKQIQANQKFGNREENGYTLGHQIEDRARGMFGAKSRIENLETSKSPITKQSEILKKVTDTESSVKKRALDKHNDGSASDIQKPQAVRDASSNLSQAEARVRALEDPNKGKTEFRVGKYKSTDANKAQQDYEAAISLAKASVNKSNFVDLNTGNFDQNTYDLALKAAAATVQASDYSIAYATDADAKAAYIAAVNAKTQPPIQRANYTTDADFEAALDAAAAIALINKEMYIKGYESQDKADEAHAQELDKAKADLDAAEKDYVAKWVEQGGDNAVDTMLTELETHVNEYNKTSSTKRKIEFKQQDAKSAYKIFVDKVKKDNVPGSYRKAINETNREIIETDAEINRIKNETSGSGIGDKK